MTQRFVLKGPDGAVQFILYTNWQLPTVNIQQSPRNHDHLFCKPMAADVGYHSPKPMYKGQTSQPKCPYLGGKPCYYDGSGLQAEEVFQIMVAKGGQGLWAELRERYTELFLKAPTA